MPRKTETCSWGQTGWVENGASHPINSAASVSLHALLLSQSLFLFRFALLVASKMPANRPCIVGVEARLAGPAPMPAAARTVAPRRDSGAQPTLSTVIGTRSHHPLNFDRNLDTHQRLSPKKFHRRASTALATARCPMPTRRRRGGGADADARPRRGGERRASPTATAALWPGRHQRRPPCGRQ